MSEISPISAAAPLTSTSAAASASEAAAPEIQFPSGADLENYQAGKAKKQDVTNTLKNLKKSGQMEYSGAYFGFIGKDCIYVKGNGKMTYGQLRHGLGVPPRVLSETNGKKLQDDQKISGQVRVNVEDIGWYAITPEYSNEAADIRAQRAAGNHFAGYDRAISYDEVVKLAK